MANVIPLKVFEKAVTLTAAHGPEFVILQNKTAPATWIAICNYNSSADRKLCYNTSYTAISSVYFGSEKAFYYYKTTDNGETWSTLLYIDTGGRLGIASYILIYAVFDIHNFTSYAVQSTIYFAASQSWPVGGPLVSKKRRFAQII